MKFVVVIAQQNQNDVSRLCYSTTAAFRHFGCPSHPPPDQRAGVKAMVAAASRKVLRLRYTPLRMTASWATPSCQQRYQLPVATARRRRVCLHPLQTQRRRAVATAQRLHASENRSRWPMCPPFKATAQLLGHGRIMTKPLPGRIRRPGRVCPALVPYPNLSGCRRGTPLPCGWPEPSWQRGAAATAP